MYRLSLLLGLAITGAFLSTPHASFSQTSEIIITGSSGPAGSMGGIALNKADASGTQIYGVSTADGKVFILDTTIGQTLNVFGLERGIVTPDDLVVASNGDIYYTDTLGGFVGKIDAATTVMTPLNNLVTQPLFLVNSIALSEDELHLYVGVCFFQGVPNFIWHFDLSTVPPIVTPLQDGLGQPLTFGASCSLNGMDYRDGYLYGAQTVTGDIFRVGPLNVPGQAPQKSLVVAGETTLAQCPGRDAYFVNPAAVKLDSHGRLYVIDAFSNELSVIKSPTQPCQKPKKVVTLPGPGGVAGLAIDTHNGDSIFVSSQADGYIARVSPADQEVQGYVKTSGLVLPLGVAAVGGNTLYLGDYSTLRQVNLQKKKEKIQSVTQTVQGSLDGSGIVTPFTVARFGSNLLLSDWLDQFIQVYDPVSDVPLANINTRILGFGSPLNALEYRSTPSDPPSIVAAHFVSTPVAPIPTARLVKYSGPGFATPAVLGAPYPSRQFTGLATDGTTYWVADAIAGTIHSFDDSGIGAAVASGLSNPRGLAAYGGRLYVIEGAPAMRLTSVRLSDGFKTVIEANIPVQPANPVIADRLVPGVTVDPANGDIYYSAPGDRTLRRIRRSIVDILETP